MSHPHPRRLTDRRLPASLLLASVLTACTPPVTPPETPPGTARTLHPAGLAWTEPFDSLDATRWAATDLPGFWQTPGLNGTFDPAQVSVTGGYLRLALTVQRCPGGLCARAAELRTTGTFGFGRYTFRVRTASTSSRPTRSGRAVSGNVSAAFSYVDNSATEIDLEIQGHRPTTLNATVWNTLDRVTSVALPAGVNFATDFQTLAYEWRPDRITYFLNGQPVWETTQDIPQQAAHVMLNLWPTDQADWGGLATPGTVYMLVDSVQFEPF